MGPVLSLCKRDLRGLARFESFCDDDDGGADIGGGGRRGFKRASRCWGVNRFPSRVSRRKATSSLGVTPVVAMVSEAAD